MKKKLSKTEARDFINEFFKDIKNKTPKEVKKVKVLAMSKNIPLKDKRKLFCKKCYVPYKSPKIRVRSGLKTVLCEKCGYLSRWKLG